MNQLKLSQQQSILTLHKAGWSNRAIARELGLHRETVGKYLRSETPVTPAATVGSDPPKPAISTLGSAPEVDSKPAISTAGSVAARSVGSAPRSASCATSGATRRHPGLISAGRCRISSDIPGSGHGVSVHRQLSVREAVCPAFGSHDAAALAAHGM